MSTFDELIQAKFAEVELEREQMHAYQSDIALPFLRDNPFSALFVDMGLGKSITSATLICDLLAEFATDKVLVIGPLRVMTDTWPNEFRKWRHTAAFNFTLIREDDDDPRIKLAEKRDREPAVKQRRARIREQAEIILKERLLQVERRDLSGLRKKRAIAQVKREYHETVGVSFATEAREEIRGELARSRTSVHFINREQLEWLVNFHGEDWPYRTVIIDESSSFKDHRTERFKALKKVRQTPGLITRLHLLTATPAAETYEHLFAQMYLLDLGKRLGKNITHYLDDYFSYNRYSMKYTLRPGCEEQILDKMKDICLVMKAKDYLDLDEPTIVQRPVKLSESTMLLYEQMKEDCLVTLDDGTEIEAETAAALSSKLLQMASGVLYETQHLMDYDTGDMAKVKRVHKLHDAKIETLKEIHEGLQGSPVLVAYHFKSSLDRLKKVFPKATVMDRDGKCIKDWNDGKIPMLLIHPQSGGHGLNLQKGGHNIVFFDLVWSLELWIQLIGRLARQGQKNPVLVQVLIATGTLDEVVMEALLSKTDAQDKLFLLLKRLIRRYRKGHAREA